MKIYLNKTITSCLHEIMVEYIENSLTTLNKKDPVSESNSLL